MTIERSGKVTRRLVHAGSKSEHEAVVLDTGDEEYVLRRLGGNAFRDATLDELVGKKLRATGILRGADFIMSDWNEVAE